ncbi:hypothetical protein GSI_13138 [Ganoderma sinense ZZ0214-1]|uniref:Uncharacterized protein n=1 Tax=Ganoderma sinense ZZ0214-1 TaxID=1077348 RepID=A0A2G8RUS6_9APHY|nr:hypothetical protein GSI_13138 [Ganoderma sinense ZZ0214-1]
MGGSDSKSAAPKDEDGLNGLMPPKPVCWRCIGAPPAEDIEMDGAPVEFVCAVAPVGCDESEEKSESENVEPEVVLDVGCDASGERPPKLGFCVTPAGLDSNANDVATLAMIDGPFALAPFAGGLDVPFSCDAGANPPKLGNAPVCIGCCCGCCCWVLTPIASSIRVGGLGTGGGAVTTCPNGLREPV